MFHVLLPGFGTASRGPGHILAAGFGGGTCHQRNDPAGGCSPFLRDFAGCKTSLSPSSALLLGPLRDSSLHVR